MKIKPEKTEEVEGEELKVLPKPKVRIKDTEKEAAETAPKRNPSRRARGITHCLLLTCSTRRLRWRHAR